MSKYYREFCIAKDHMLLEPFRHVLQKSLIFLPAKHYIDKYHCNVI